MKKLLPFIIALVVIGGGVAAYLATKKDDPADTKQASTASDDKSSEAASKYSDACTLFTPEAIGSALGGTYGTGEEDISVRSADGLEGSACKFEQDNDGTTAGMTAALDLSAEILNFKSTDSASNFMAGIGQTIVDGEVVSTVTKVDAVGDEALFWTSADFSEKGETMNVRIGKQIIVLTAIQLDGVDRDAVRSGMTALAKSL